jgi:hypothetical protein
MRYTLAFLITLLSVSAVQARDIDLVTLPPRDKVQLTIYNSEDLTLAKETRSLTFKKGLNKLEFSWANTLIDPTSAYLRILAHEKDIEVLDTTFPADRPQVLIWNVESKFEGQVPVEVSYFTSGISWNADYVMVTDKDETKASFDGYVTVVNNSGEDYENAEVRLVVGTINLVEKIQQLAARTGEGGVTELDEEAQKGLALRQQIEAAAPQFEASLGGAAGVGGGGGGLFGLAPEIIKEGLSEYFIFTVEGRQTVKNGWSQRMISSKAKDVSFEILYRYRPDQYGDRPVRFFILANDKEHKMGESPLPDGVIRVFRQTPQGGLSFYTEEESKYIPIKEKIELNVGSDDQVVYERVVQDVTRQNFVFDETSQPEPPVVGWDETRKWKETLRNYRAKPIKMEFRHVLDGDVEFVQHDGATLYDFQTVEYTLTVQPGGKPLVKETSATFHLGDNSKQDTVRLVDR